MHGFIFSELKKLVDAKLGAEAWSRLVAEANVSTRHYLSVGEYPDEDAVRLVVALAKQTKRDVGELLEDFGEFIAPDLLEMYGHLVRPEWKTLDVIEHTESTIHRVVRARDPAAKPPELRTVRNGDEVVITYASKRRMCGVAIGIARGIAKRYGERLVIDQPTCMLKGAPECTIRVKRVRV